MEMGKEPGKRLRFHLDKTEPLTGGNPCSCHHRTGAGGPVEAVTDSKGGYLCVSTCGIPGQGRKERRDPGHRAPAA